MGTPDAANVDLRVRVFTYDRLMTGGEMPSAAEVAGGLGIDLEEVRASFRRMKESHILVLQEGDREILMANPFSAVPTPFLVNAGPHSWWGNCIWDAMGIAAMVKGDARIGTGCGDCNDAMVLIVENGALRSESGDGVIHFSIPAKRWWDNIKFT
jgi:Alkylmercury lyase